MSTQLESVLEVQHPDKYINLNADDRFVEANVLRKSYLHDPKSINVAAPPFVNINDKYELGIVDTNYNQIARAVSSILTRSLSDAKYTNGGYLPPSVVERVQKELISPYGVREMWGKTGNRFILSRDAKNGKREIISTALIHQNMDGIFFFTSKFNNLNHNTLQDELDLEYFIHGNPKYKWLDKFCFPALEQYKPKNFHHFANFVVEKEGLRGQGLSRLMIQEIVKNYAKEYIIFNKSSISHSQKLLCGRGLWQIGDPPWLARMKRLGFYLRLGCETFHIDTKWDPLISTFNQHGQVIDHVSYNKSFDMPEIYIKMLSNCESNSEYQKIYHHALKDLKGGHLFYRIPKVIEMAQSGTAKLQFFQLIFPFAI